ncbi:MAG: hypothetical protein EBX52_09360 [Proteobacteria bacterium]|nr:hypothetical protein [Pseudomonadota bacterium]
MAHAPLIPFLAALNGLIPGSFAAPIPADGCFATDRPVTSALRPAPARYPDPGKETASSGRDPATGYAWAMVDATLPAPIAQLLNKVADPMTTKGEGNPGFEVLPLKLPGTYRKDRVHVRIKPVFFLTLEWDEDWSTTIKDGTAEAPRVALVSYQKTNGTSHIDHFCGNIQLERISETTTGIHLVEEIKADRRSPEDVLNGLRGTLRTLQK